MSERRRYTKRDKVRATVSATLASAAAASRATGIPETNIRRWRDDPEMAEYGAKAREEIAEEARALSVKVLAEIRERLPQFDPKDLAVLFGILTDKGQLLAGQATARTETVTAGLSDHERDQLRAVIQRALAETPAE